MLAPLTLDRESPAPLYRQIVAHMRAAITSGTLMPGQRLASTRTLAEDWGVSRNTVLQVFEILVGEGFLEARVGDGTYISPNPPDAGTRDRGTQRAAEHDPQTTAAYPFRRLSRRGSSLIEQRATAGASERPLPFMPDVPDLRMFPMRTWLRLMNEVSGRLTGDALVQVANTGYDPLRQAIAHYLRTARDVDCTAEQVIVTSGSQQGLDLISRMLLDTGDPVWIEEPGYIGLRAALTANGCNVLPVPADGGGLDVETGCRHFPAPRMICVSAARQYPLGSSLAPARREALIDFATRAGSWILEDDYDSEMRYSGKYLPALQSIDRAGRVIYMGTFSKTLLPSFRLGYLVVPKDLIRAFTVARAVVDRHAPILEQMVLAEFMHRGLYASHLRRMRTVYRERQQAMLAVLADVVGYTPPDFEIEGGMHFVLPLHAHLDDQQVVNDLAQAQIIARPLSIYYAGRHKRPGILLGFAAYAPEAIEEAGNRLALLRSLVDRRRDA